MLTEAERSAADRALEDLCERRYPEGVREHARPEIVWERGALTLYERRPPWRREYGPAWSRQPIARFRRTGEGWVLYCADRNGRWRNYANRGPTPTITPHVEDLEEDATGIFWG